MNARILILLLIPAALAAQGMDGGSTHRGAIRPLTKHWEKPIPNQRVPDGLQSLNAEECGACHADNYREWKQSTHALALRDPQFVSEMKKDGVALCLNCHTPLQNQLPTIITGWIGGDYHKPAQTPNPQYDSTLRDEAITCAACHVRDGFVIGPNGNTKAPHATRRDSALLTPQLCLGCHNVVDTLNPLLVCTFETGEEWKRNKGLLSGNTCISCHMPTVTRPVADGEPPRRTRVHAFPGSGIPKLMGTEAAALNGLEITADSIIVPVVPGSMFRYQMRLKNASAGHSVPTGDPERYYLITLQVTGAAGEVVKKEQYRIGEEWEWYPAARKVSDNNLALMEERAYDIACRVPAQRELQLSVEVTKHRMTEKNAKYDGLFGVYPLSITVFKKTYPIRVRKRKAGAL
jgi:hypothetical protein